MCKSLLLLKNWMNIANIKSQAILPLFIPYLLSWLTQSDPEMSYLVAWTGSFFIFYWTWFSPSRYISTDLDANKQIMRPIFFTQLIFAGFMCSTSIFYFLNHLGYEYLERVNVPMLNDPQIYLIAECQRLSVLGHAALVTGLIWNTKYHNPEKKFKLNPDLNIDRLLIQISIAAYLAGMAFRKIPAISQFSVGLTNMAIICAAFLVVKGVTNKKPGLLITGGILVTVNLINASLSGFKEPILTSILVMGCLFFPYYKRMVLLIGIPVMYGLFYILPTYVSIIRSQSWNGEISATEASSGALQNLFDADNDQNLNQTNWAFLTNRFSEIDMFTKFVDNTPKHIDYYGLEIIVNSIKVIIPRFLWPSKPSIETLSMERVYNAGVVSRDSSVSAKPRPVVDAYLSAGTIGVVICLFIYGFSTQWLCNKAESLFGGYQVGSIIIFNGLFQGLWRGNNFEFLVSSIFWSFILMLLMYLFFKSRAILVPVEENEQHLNQNIL